MTMAARRVAGRAAHSSVAFCVQCLVGGAAVGVGGAVGGGALRNSWERSPKGGATLRMFFHICGLVFVVRPPDNYVDPFVDLGPCPLRTTIDTLRRRSRGGPASPWGSYPHGDALSGLGIDRVRRCAPLWASRLRRGRGRWQSPALRLPRSCSGSCGATRARRRGSWRQARRPPLPRRSRGPGCAGARPEARRRSAAARG
jgi:hypothetical protein